MSKIISAKHECRVWAKGFIAENNYFGPLQGDFTKFIKRVQGLGTSSIQFKVSYCESLTLSRMLTIVLPAGKIRNSDLVNNSKTIL